MGQFNIKEMREGRNYWMNTNHAAADVAASILNAGDPEVTVLFPIVCPREQAEAVMDTAIKICAQRDPETEFEATSTGTREYRVDMFAAELDG